MTEIDRDRPNEHKNKSDLQQDKDKKFMPFQCIECSAFGATRKRNEIYWTCVHCGTVGGLFIEPIKFRFLVNNKYTK